MTFTELITRLLACGIRFGAVDDGRLRFKAPKGTIGPELLVEIRHHRSTLLQWLGPSQLPAESPGTESSGDASSPCTGVVPAKPIPSGPVAHVARTRKPPKPRHPAHGGLKHGGLKFDGSQQRLGFPKGRSPFRSGGYPRRRRTRF